MKRTRLAAIDVGTTKVCTIMADCGGESGLRILGVGITPSEGMHKGMVVDVNTAKNSIRQSVRLAEQTAGYRLESANVGITGRHVTSANKQGTIAIGRQDQVVRPADLKRVLDAARSIQVPGPNKLIHVIPRVYKLDNQEGVVNPVGMHGSRLDVETHVISAAVTSIQNLTKCVRGIGIEVDNLVLEPLASGEAVLTEEEKQKGVIVADIGGGTTDVAVYKDDTVYHTAVIPVAGYQVTRDISIGLDLSFENAEQIKKKFGDVTPVDGRNRPPDTMLSYNGSSVSANDLSEILRVRIEELMRLIVLEMPQSGLDKLVPAGLVLTGGGACLPGIAELAVKATHLPARVGVPFGVEGVFDSLRSPAYATGVGLLAWELSQTGKQNEELKRGGGVKALVNKLLQLFR